jgi:hypothetical protein
MPLSKIDYNIISAYIALNRPPSLIQRWKQHFRNMNDTNYGLTETTGRDVSIWG